LWLPKDDLRDSSSWVSSPLVLLRDIHSKLLTQYDSKEVCAQSQSQVNVGAGPSPSSQSGAGPRPSSQDGVPQSQETAILIVLQLNRLVEDSFVWDESSASNADVTVIPSQFKVTKQILLHWQPCRDLKLMFAGSHRAEQLSLVGSHHPLLWWLPQQRVVATVEESVLKMEMTGLESQEEDAPKRLLFFKPMSWLGQIRPHRRDESWSPSLCQTFFSTSMGAQIPAIAEKPLATGGCRKFQLDPLGDHLNTCTAHSGAKKAHDWMVDQVADFFRTTHKVKTQCVVKNRGHHCGDIELAGYLANAAGPVPLVLDLRITHDRMGSSSDPSLNGHSKYPNNLDQSLNVQLLIKYGNIVLTTTTGRRVRYHLCLLLRVRVGGYIVNLSDFYSQYSLIEKLTAFLHLQEFSLHKHTQVASSTSAARLSSRSFRVK
jgi:hypothetical protein